MPTIENFEFFDPTKIISGKRALENLPFELQCLGASRPFCVWTSHGRKRNVGMVIRAFKGSGMTLTVAAKVAIGPDSGQLEQMAVDFNAAGCDAILAIGDHPQLEIARRLSLLISGQRQDLAALSPTERPLDPSCPLIHIVCGSRELKESPQPAGTATSRIQEKPHPGPTLVVIDPRLLTRTPSMADVSEALSILALCSESATGPSRNPVMDCYARVAIRAVIQHVPGLGGKDNWPAAHLALANAKILCECVRANSSAGLSHLLGQELAQVSRFPSGILTGIVLPYSLEVVARKNPDAVADLLLPLGGAELYGITTDCLRARKAINLIHELLHSLNQRSGGRIPATLQQADLTEETLFQVARAASNLDPARNQEALCLEILKHAWLGRPLWIASRPTDGRSMDA